MQPYATSFLDIFSKWRTHLIMYRIVQCKTVSQFKNILHNVIVCALAEAFEAVNATISIRMIKSHHQNRTIPRGSLRRSRTPA